MKGLIGHERGLVGRKKYEEQMTSRLGQDQLETDKRYETWYRTPETMFFGLSLVLQVQEISEPDDVGSVNLDARIVDRDGSLVEDPVLPLIVDPGGFIVEIVKGQAWERGYFLRRASEEHLD